MDSMLFADTLNEAKIFNIFI